VRQAAITRLTKWSARRHGTDSLPMTVNRRRIYIIPSRFGIALALLLAAHVAFYRLNLEAAVARIKNDFVYAAALGGAVAAILPFINANVQPFIYFQF